MDIYHCILLLVFKYVCNTSVQSMEFSFWCYLFKVSCFLSKTCSILPNTFKRWRFFYYIPCTRLQNFVNVSPLVECMFKARLQSYNSNIHISKVCKHCFMRQSFHGVSLSVIPSYCYSGFSFRSISLSYIDIFKWKLAVRSVMENHPNSKCQLLDGFSILKLRMDNHP